MGNYLGICWQYVWEHPWASAIVGIIATAFTPPIKKLWTKIVVKLLENWLTRIMTWWRGNSSESNSDTKNDRDETIDEGQPHVNSAEAERDDRNATRRRPKKDLDDRSADEPIDECQPHQSGNPYPLVQFEGIKANLVAYGVDGLYYNSKEYEDGEEFPKEESEMAENEKKKRKPGKVKAVQGVPKGERNQGCYKLKNVKANAMIMDSKNVTYINQKNIQTKSKSGSIRHSRGANEVNKAMSAAADEKHDGQSQKPGMDRSVLSKVEEITQEKSGIYVGGCKLKFSTHSVKEPSKHDIKYNVVPGAPPSGHIHASSTLTFSPLFQGQKNVKILLPTWCSSEASVLVGIFTKTEEGDWNKLESPTLTHEGHLELQYRYLSNLTAFVSRDMLPVIQFKISCFLYNNVDGKFAMGFCLDDGAIETLFRDRLKAKGFVFSSKTLEPLTASFEDEIAFKIIPGQKMAKIRFNVDEQFLSSHQGHISYCNTNGNDTCEYKITQKKKLDSAVGNQAEDERIIYRKSYRITKKKE